MDVLYVFIKKGGGDYLKFEDKVELVKQGTKDMVNVVVVPSERYVLQNDIMSDKDKRKGLYVELDIIDDFEVFMDNVVKEFDIKIRFANNEQSNPYMRKYNEYIKSVLCKNDIKFIEIPRKTIGDKVICGGLVRKYLKEKNFDEIKKLVPDTTLEYLKKTVKEELKC